MHVTVKVNFPRFQGAFHHQFGVIVNRIQFRRTCNPLPIQVHSHQRASIVSHNDTVWILHWNDLKYKRVSQVFGYIGVSYQKLNHPIHYVRGVGLARMHSWSEDDRFPYCNFNRIRCKVRNNQHVDIISCKRLAEYSFAYFVFILNRALLLDEFAKISVGIRIAVRQKHCVIIMSELKLEGKSVVEQTIATIWLLITFFACGRISLERLDRSIRVPLLPFFARSLVVSDVEAIAVPAQINTICLLDWINQWFHALVVVAIRFHQVHYVKPIGHIFPCILDPEKVPLRLSTVPVVVF